MAEVNIRGYTRRGKNGTTVQVRGYTRRVGIKGVRSVKLKDAGKELQKRVSEKTEPIRMLSPKELALQREVMQSTIRAEAERKSLGLTREQYSRMKLNGNKSGALKKEPLRGKKKRERNNAIDHMEDRLESFVNKYSKRKYKRYFD